MQEIEDAQIMAGTSLYIARTYTSTRNICDHSPFNEILLCIYVPARLKLR